MILIDAGPLVALLDRADVNHSVCSELWRLYSVKRLVFHEFASREMERMAGLMKQYRDTPIDLADASLIVTAESRAIRRVFSVDSDFYIYRLSDGSVLEVIR